MGMLNGPAPGKQDLGLNNDHCQTKSNALNTKKPSPHANAQRKAILRQLQKSQCLTTLFIREKMGIMHPAARIMELRQMGYDILLHWVFETDVAGTNHRVGHYVLRQESTRR
jgi:hypothetical protein